MFLATQTPPDLIGYQFKGTLEWEGKQVTITDPTLPLWMVDRRGQPKPVWAYKRGVLLLDEFGQGEADTKRASAQLLLKKTVGPWFLGNGWGVIACSNRAEDRSGTTKSFDFIINRRVEFHITPDVGSWVEWATKAGHLMPLTIAYAVQNPHIVFSGKIPDKQGPYCTPRSLVMLDAMLQVAARDHNGVIPSDGGTIEMSQGMIGDAAHTYFSFVRLQLEMPKLEDILRDPDKVKVPTAPDAQMLICYNLAHRVEEATAEPIIRYIDRFGKEFAVTFAKAACQRMPLLVITPAFVKWAKSNSSLMAMITSK